MARGDGEYLIKGKGRESRETLWRYLSGGVRYASQVRGRREGKRKRDRKGDR